MGALPYDGICKTNAKYYYFLKYQIFPDTETKTKSKLINLLHITPLQKVKLSDPFVAVGYFCIFKIEDNNSNSSIIQHVPCNFTKLTVRLS